MVNLFKRNQDVRQAIKTSKIPTWAVAERLGIHEHYLYVILRRELTEKKKKDIFLIIEKLKEEANYD